MKALDLFCGAGGASTGLADAGYEVVGVEIDRDATRTHHAAGHGTIRADVTTLDPARFDVDLIWASPPCTDWSMAGRRARRDGDTGHLVDEVERWATEGKARIVIAEQVPPALDEWRRIADRLTVAGWSTWCGILSAERYGVPQTRRRAYLIARRDGQARPPEPTHQGYRDTPTAGLFGELEQPVSMAGALGWGLPRWTLHTNCDGGRQTRTVDAPTPAFTSKSGGQWNVEPGSVKLTVAEAATLQGFPDGYPFHGTKTSKFRQIGNAVCPPMARAIAEANA